jgi:hypothetical protein
MKKISFALALLAAISIVVQPVAPAYATIADEPIQSAPLQKLDLPMVQRALVATQTLDEFILDAQINRDVRDTLAHHAGQGEAAILSRAQMDDLARTQPALHAKLMNAYRTMSVPHLTTNEKRLVDQMTAGNLAAFKAGLTTGCDTVVGRNLGNVHLAAAGPISVATGNLQQNCSDNNATGAWVVIGLMLALILGWPLLCAMLGNPPFCRGVTQH